MSAAQLIETSEEDSSLAVARFIGDLLNDGEVGWPAWGIMRISTQAPGGLSMSWLGLAAGSVVLLSLLLVCNLTV